MFYKNTYPPYGRKNVLIFLLIIIPLFLFFFISDLHNSSNVVNKESIQELREKHANYLKNSPFKETLKLSKKERKALGIPPNKYYEEQWELTMNPSTGIPEPQFVLNLQSELRNKRLTGRTPGESQDNKWEDRGPNNVGGRTRVVMFDPNDATNKKVYAGAVGGGLWYTNDIEDVNASWIQVDGVPGNMNVSCITVDPRDSNTWYIGTGELYTQGAAVGNGVYKTINGGVTWTQIPILSDVGNDLNNGIYFITSIVARDNGISTDIFVGVGSSIHAEFLGQNNFYNNLGGSSYGLYKSLDNGNSWIRVQNEVFDFITPNDFELTSDNTLWMSTTASDGRIFKSINGNDWIEMGASPLPTSNRVEIAVSSTNPNKLYALTQGRYDSQIPGSNYPHIFVTEDGFETIKELVTPNDADFGIGELDFTRGQAFYDLVIEVDPSNDDIVYVGGIDLFRTEIGSSISNSGDWVQISKWINSSGLEVLNCSYVHADQQAFAFHPTDSNKAVVGCDGGVFYANDLINAGVSDVFIERNKDYNVTQFYYGGYGQDINNELIIAGAQDNGTQFMNGAINGANPSQEIYGGDGVYSTVDKDGEFMIASYIYNSYFYFKLPYTGEHYQIESTFEGKFVNPAGLDHNLNILFTYQSSDKINRYILGENSSMNIQIVNKKLSLGATAFKVSPFIIDATILYIGTADGKLLKVTNAHLDSELMVWEEITGDEFLGSISDIEFGLTENDIFVTFYSYGVKSIWYTSNGGISWHSKEGDLPNMPVRSILQNPMALNEVIIGTELGVWRTSNFQEDIPSWTQSNNGMRDVKVVDLDIRADDSKVLATTHGRGVFTGFFTPESTTTFTFDTQNAIPDLCNLNEVAIDFDFKSTGSFNEVVNISLTGVPINATVLISPNNQVINNNFQITIGNLDLVQSGKYEVIVNASSSSLSINKDIVLNVNNKNINSVQLLSPLNGADKIPISNSTFSWEEDLNATSYEFEIASDPLFENIIESEIVNDAKYISGIDLEEASTYFWRVRGVNDCVKGEFSEVYYFQTNILCQRTTKEINNLIANDLVQEPFIYESKLNISQNYLISDIRLQVDLYYENIESMEFILISPNNTQVKVFSPVCIYSESSNLELTFEDHSENEINCTLAYNFTNNGHVKPFESLSKFKGEQAGGEWTLRVIVNDFNTPMKFRNWFLEICTEESLSASEVISNYFIVQAGNKKFITQNYLKVFSEGSSPSQQVFTLSTLPELGILSRGDKVLQFGDSFTQLDINEGLISYSNSIVDTATDYFNVNIKNATGGYVADYKFDMQIDKTFIDDDGDGVSNENDICPNTIFNVKVDLNGCFEDYFSDDGDGVDRENDLCSDTVLGMEVNSEGCAKLDNFYIGTVSAGGKYNAGLLYKIDKTTSTYTKLLDFKVETQGNGPNNGLILASNGRFYGTTDSGGTHGYGVLFEYNVLENEIIKKFDFNIAQYPRSRLVENNDKLYGLAYDTRPINNDFGGGAIYEYDIINNEFKILKEFIRSESKGSNPDGKIVIFEDVIYGTVPWRSGVDNHGLFFKYDLLNDEYTIIHEFEVPIYRAESPGIIKALNGKIYGTFPADNYNITGLLFEYDLITKNFTKILDGDIDNGPWFSATGFLIQGADELLYSASNWGGDKLVGAIYSFDTETNLYDLVYSFGYKSKDSWFPVGVLFEATPKVFFGMAANTSLRVYEETYIGTDHGVIFKYDHNTGGFSVLHRFMTREDGFVSYNTENSLIEVDFNIIDEDWDRVMKYDDNCPDMANNNQNDSDNDGVGDVCDVCVGDDASGDADNDGVCDNIDECPDTISGAVVDLKGCSDDQLDDDGDGVMNNIDLCPDTVTGETVDSDGCSESQLDDDGDGVMNNIDSCPDTLSGELVDLNGCAENQLDDDGDGIMNNLDLCPNTVTGETVDSDGCSESQLDDDGDGVMNGIDSCPDTLSGELVDLNGCAENQLDDDGDGVMNDIDQCPNTNGANVNELGCISISSDNFQIEVVGETCLDKNNGQINIATTESYNYTATINGEVYEFTTSLTVGNLSSGEYSICITVAEEPNYEQCFGLVVEEASEITGKSSRSKFAGKITETIEITSGTAPYTLSINGIEVRKSSSTTFSVEVFHGDQLSVSSRFACEGKFEKRINLIDDFVVYPNPTNDIAEIAMPNINKKEIVISIFNLQQQLISRRAYQIENGTVEISLKDRSTGMYLIQIELEYPVYLKIMKR